MKIDFKLPRWKELPEVDLYLEQVVVLIDNAIGKSVGNEGHKVLTRTMINNYVKQKVINSPVNKKYNKDALAALFVVAILKNICTMEEIKRLIRLALVANSIDKSYDLFCDVIESAVYKTFSGDSISAKNDLTEAQYILHNVGRAFASQLYVRKVYLYGCEVSDEKVKNLANVNR